MKPENTFIIQTKVVEKVSRHIETEVEGTRYYIEVSGHYIVFAQSLPLEHMYKSPQEFVDSISCTIWPVSQWPKLKEFLDGEIERIKNIPERISPLAKETQG